MGILDKKIGVKYPTKTNINFAVREAKSVDRKSILPIGIFVLICFLGFLKLGVLDLRHSVNQAETSAQQAQEQLNQMKEANSVYEDVLKEYNESVSLSITSPVIATLSQRLEIVNQYLISKAKVESFNVMDDIITVRISGVTLNQVSGIYTDLMTNSFVSNVQIYTASTDGESGSLTTATMTIILAVDETKVDSNEEGGEGQ
ncbi:hypothetical protein DSECCO2_152190 [anaerobic digester metagenome]